MRLAWLLLAVFALAGCTRQPAIAPHGIVSNNPCIDAVLAEIALPGQVRIRIERDIGATDQHIDRIAVEFGPGDTNRRGDAVVDVADGDRVRIAWHASNITSVIAAHAPVTNGIDIPGTPSVIVTVNQVR